MEKKSTGELSQELMDQPNLDAYIHANQEFFQESNITNLQSQLHDQKAISKAELARRAGISEVYIHQVFSGRRKPTRDRLVCICFGLQATLEETQELLKRAGYAQLYPKNKREAIIAHGIIHRTPLEGINERLFVENEKTLF